MTLVRILALRLVYIGVTVCWGGGSFFFFFLVLVSLLSLHAVVLIDMSCAMSLGPSSPSSPSSLSISFSLLGKQTLIAAAYDDRLLSVAGSSPGFPIATPARFATNAFAGEQWPSSVTGAGSPCPDKHDGCSWWTSSAQQFYGQ